MNNNWKVIGLDALTKYYDPKLKNDRLDLLKYYPNFDYNKGLLEDKELLDNLFQKHNPKIIIHLAAQAGVRYSLDNPDSYVQSNLLGTFNILEMAKKYIPEHLLIASTSSVYGNNKKLPFDENQKTDTQISFYASTKKSNEVMAHSYSHLFKIPTTIMRFFTVYGPWGRPDMALFKFTNNILSDIPIDIYNFGEMKRDFTYIDDVIKAISLLIDIIPPEIENRKYKIKEDSLSETAPFRIVNIGSAKPVKLMHYITELENEIGKVAKKNFLNLQHGDMLTTYSNSSLLKLLTGFLPEKNIKFGINKFVQWYKNYYLK